jgi:hypothetical protein
MHPSEPPSPSPAADGRARRLGRRLRAGLVFGVVAWHLFFFAVRNPLDLWDTHIYAWLEARGWCPRCVKAIRRADDVTYRYANTLGCEQRWVMFRPPMARGASFLGYRLEFADGTSQMLRSPNEPTPARFFRLGGWQLRKFEEHLTWPPDDLARDPERAFWEAYAREIVRRWRQDNPGDDRRVKRLVLVRRRVTFTTPDDLPGEYPPASETDLAAFDPEGRLLP